MLEISPVLAGTYDKPNYIPASVNFNQGDQASGTTASDASSDVDSRRYSQYDRSASKVASANMSFGDVLDMLNPLQHIPVVSSIYRYATGDTINPVSRVAGDILYGAVGGIVGAVAGAVGAIGDSVAESETGKDMTGVVVATLFGDDGKDTKNGGDAPTQLASATQPELVTADIPTIAAPAATPAAAPAVAAQTVAGAKSIALANNKPSLASMGLPDYHTENMKMSVAQATGLHIGNTVYPNFGRNSMRSLAGPAPSSNTVPSKTTPAVAARMAALKLQPAVPASTASAPTAPAGSATPAPAPTIASKEPPSPAAVAAALSSAQNATPTGTDTSAAVAAAASNPATIAAQQQAATPTDTTMPAGLKDDALILKALGMYRSVADGTVSVARGQSN